MMNRRTILKHLTLIAGGVLVLPSCDVVEEKATIALNNLNITKKQEELLAELVGAIIPNGAVPGAKELSVQNFVWVMVDDCMEKQDQQRFINGLNLFHGYSRKSGGQDFLRLLPEKQKLILTEILAIKRANEKEIEDNLSDIYFTVSTIKKITILGYMHSKYIMTEIMPYSLIPGSYEPCRQIDHSKQVNIYA